MAVHLPGTAPRRSATARVHAKATTLEAALRCPGRCNRLLGGELANLVAPALVEHTLSKGRSRNCQRFGERIAKASEAVGVISTEVLDGGAGFTPASGVPLPKLRETESSGSAERDYRHQRNHH